jgi:hypothetical protein
LDADSGILPGLRRIDPVDRERIPERYRPLVGWPAAYAALGRIRELAAQRGAAAYFLQDLYWFEYPSPGSPPGDFFAQLFERVDRLGYFIVNPARELLAFLGQNQYASRALWLTPRDGHPNAVRHALTAKVLYRRLVETGVLPDSEPRRRTLVQDLRRWDEMIEVVHRRENGLRQLSLRADRRRLPQVIWRRHLELRPGRQTGYLGMGWCPPQEQGSWICGDLATLSFRIQSPSDLQIRLKARAPEGGRFGPQLVEAELNGRVSRRVRLDSQGFFNLIFDFPAAVTGRGLNRLVLVCDWVDRLAPGSKDSRLVSLLVSEVDFSVPVSLP